MNVNLHIERIVLDGVELAPGEDRVLQQLVSRELTSLLTREGLSALHGGGVGTVAGRSIRLGSTGATALGTQLAHSIHHGINAVGAPAPEGGGE